MLLWGGGIWDWLDAPTAIRAVSRLPDDVVLVFQGVKRPALLERDEHAAGAAAVSLARAWASRARAWCSTTTGCRTRSAARGCWRPTSASRPTPPTSRRASPTAPGSPTTCGAGSRSSRARATSSATSSRSAGLGRAVPPGDDAAFAAACSDLLRDSEPERANVRSAAEDLRWDRVVRPLLDFCLTGTKRTPTRHRARQIRNATIGQYAPIAMETLRTDGPANLTRKLAANARRALKRT